MAKGAFGLSKDGESADALVALVFRHAPALAGEDHASGLGLGGVAFGPVVGEGELNAGIRGPGGLVGELAGICDAGDVHAVGFGGLGEIGNLVDGDKAEAEDVGLAHAEAFAREGGGSALQGDVVLDLLHVVGREKALGDEANVGKGFEIASRRVAGGGHGEASGGEAGARFDVGEIVVKAFLEVGVVGGLRVAAGGQCDGEEGKREDGASTFHSGAAPWSRVGGA